MKEKLVIPATKYWRMFSSIVDHSSTKPEWKRNIQKFKCKRLMFTNFTADHMLGVYHEMKAYEMTNHTAIHWLLLSTYVGAWENKHPNHLV